LVTISGDLEIKLLKARLVLTEAALERIVAHMGSVTDRLARNGVMMGDTQVLDTRILYLRGNYDLFQHTSCSKKQQENTA
jgi:hypothetical protein